MRKKKKIGRIYPQKKVPLDYKIPKTINAHCFTCKKIHATKLISSDAAGIVIEVDGKTIKHGPAYANGYRNHKHGLSTLGIREMVNDCCGVDF